MFTRMHWTILNFSLSGNMNYKFRSCVIKLKNLNCFLKSVMTVVHEASFPKYKIYFNNHTNNYKVKPGVFKNK